MPASAGHSSPLSAVQPQQAPVVQVTGTKLKIKLVPPKPTSTVTPPVSAGALGQAAAAPTAGGDCDSNHHSASGPMQTAAATGGNTSSSGQTALAAGSYDSNLRIKIPIDKLDASGTTALAGAPAAGGGGSGKEKRKRRTDDLDDGIGGGSSKSRKVQHYWL